LLLDLSEPGNFDSIPFILNFLFRIIRLGGNHLIVDWEKLTILEKLFQLERLEFPEIFVHAIKMFFELLLLTAIRPSGGLGA
jgi:hypothetical protein